MTEPGRDPVGEVLQYAACHVPYYRRIGLRHELSLQDFPLLLKCQIQANYADFLSDEYGEIRPQLAACLAENTRHPAGDFAFGSGISVEETSGTSGTWLRCAKTIPERLRMGAALWRQRRALDPCLHDGQLFAFMPGAGTPETSAFWQQDFRSIYRHIAERPYRWLHCPTHLLERHVATCRSEGWAAEFPNLKFVECAGSFLRPETAREIGAFFRAGVADQYGTVETWAIALACSHGVHHLNSRNVHVEIVDDDGRDVPPGEMGRVVVTTLQQRLMPFLRYATGDFGRFVEKTCRCPLGASAIALIEGRPHERIHGTAGLVFGNALFMDVLRAMSAAVAFIRVRQTGTVEFTVETNPIAEPERFLAEFESEAARLLRKPVRCRHITAGEREIAAAVQAKPWLFRCEC